MAAITAPLVLLWRRIRANWRFLTVLLAGVVLATTLLASAPIYLGSTKELGLRHALQFERTGVPHTAINVPFRPLDASGYELTRQKIEARKDDTIRGLVTQEVAYIRTPPINVDLPPSSFLSGVVITGALESYSDFDTYTRVVEGAFPRPRSQPGDPVQAAIGRRSANAYQLGVGDEVIVSPSERDPSRAATVRIVGILEPIDLTDQYWTFIVDPFSPQVYGVPDNSLLSVDVPLLPLIITPESFLEEVGPAFRGALANFWWYLLVDPARVDGEKAGQVRDSIETLESDLAIDLPGSLVLSGLPATLENFERKLFFSRIPVLVMLVMVIAVVIYFLIMVANVVVDRHLGEIALLRSRGANSAQVLAVYVWEAVFICVAAFVAGPLLAILVVPWLGKAPAFSSVTNGGLLPVELTVSAFLFSLLGAGLSFAALFFPALRGARVNVLNEKARLARPPSTSVFHKYYLDLFLLAVAGILYWELTQRGSLVTRRLFGSDSTDYILLMAPAVFMVGMALLFLRFVPLLVRLLSLVASYTSKVWLVMGLWTIGRNPVHYLRPLLLLTLISGLAMFAASFNTSVERSFRDRDLYRSGSDVRLVRLPRALSGSKDELARQFQEQPGVTHVGAAFRSEPEVVTSEIRRSYHILAVDATRFHQVSWYREDFSERPLFNLLRHLDRGRSILRGRDLPEETTALGLWVQPAREYLSASLWVRVRDASGQPWRFRLGRLDFTDWQFLRSDLATSTGPGPVGPLVLESIYVFELDSPESPAPAGSLLPGFVSTLQINLSDLTAFTPSSPDGTVLDPLTVPDQWEPMATSALLPETLQANTEITRDGQPTTELSWQATAGLGVRGLFPSDYHEPLPIIAGGTFLHNTGRRVGDSLEIIVAGIPIPVRIADSVEFFPTMEPRLPFVLGNLESLLYYANLFRPNPALPNEVWITLSDDQRDRDAAIAGLSDSVYGPYLLLERDEALQSLEQDPLVGTGSRGIVFTILTVLVVVSVGGYLGYFYVSSYRNPLEFAVLRALGFSRRQLAAFQLLVHASIMLAALLLGAWIGTRAHAMIITFLQHDERGRQVLPPFTPHTDWSGVGVMLVASLATLTLVMGWQAWRFARVPIWRVLRGSEE